MTLAERLNGELDLKGWGTRRFVKEMREADPGWKGKGVSHARVKAFREGTDQPQLSWVESAAALLDVSPSWLAFGEGPRTEEARAAGGGGLRLKITREVEEIFHQTLPYKQLDQPSQSILWDTMLYCRRIKFPPASETTNSLERALAEAARYVARIIAAALNEVEDKPNRLQLNLFIQIMSRAILLMLPLEQVRAVAQTMIPHEPPDPYVVGEESF